MSNKIATTLALSAAALFLAGCGKDKPTTNPPTDGDATADAAAPTADADADADPNRSVRCYGVNECSGQTACDVAGKWDCAGNNDCRGKGWLKVTKAECDEKAGSEDESTVL
jgi:predicted small lipoprotein YifL